VFKDFSAHRRRHPRVIIELMRRNQITLTLFAAAILFSMIREWKAPVACSRAVVILTATR
jgi:hypothetical protein